MQNAVKHGMAKSITVELSSGGGIIALRVADRGQGVRQGVVTKGMGLRIMSHRAKMIGASFETRRNPDGGTIVECFVREPVRKEMADGKAQG